MKIKIFEKQNEISVFFEKNGIAKNSEVGLIASAMSSGDSFLVLSKNQEEKEKVYKKILLTFSELNEILGNDKITNAAASMLASDFFDEYPLNTLTFEEFKLIINQGRRGKYRRENEIDGLTNYKTIRYWIDQYFKQRKKAIDFLEQIEKKRADEEHALICATEGKSEEKQEEIKRKIEEIKNNLKIIC